MLMKPFLNSIYYKNNFGDCGPPYSVNQDSGFAVTFEIFWDLLLCCVEVNSFGANLAAALETCLL